MGVLRRFLSAAHPAMTSQFRMSTYPSYFGVRPGEGLGDGLGDGVEPQVIDRGLPYTSLFRSSNLMLSEWAWPFLIVAGMGMMKPCKPLSLRKLPTSGRDWFAETVASNTDPS